MGSVEEVVGVAVFDDLAFVHEDDLVGDLAGEARRACDLLGVPWDPAVLAYRERLADAPVMSPTYESVAKPIYATAIGRWRNYESFLGPVLPMLEPIRGETFRFTREWLRREAVRVADPRSPANQLGRQLNLPPSYLLIHRVTTETIGVLCQLGGEAPYRSLMEQWQPGFADA